jgi:hypothetical protein
MQFLEPPDTRYGSSKIRGITGKKLPFTPFWADGGGVRDKYIGISSEFQVRDPDGIDKDRVYRGSRSLFLQKAEEPAGGQPYVE